VPGHVRPVAAPAFRHVASSGVRCNACAPLNPIAINCLFNRLTDLRVQITVNFCVNDFVG
jgi:hypothetical protein